MAVGSPPAGRRAIHPVHPPSPPPRACCRVGILHGSPPLTSSPWRPRGRAAGVAATAAAVLLATVVLLLEAEGGFGRPVGRPTAAAAAAAAAAATAVAAAARGGSKGPISTVLPFHAAAAAVRDGDSPAAPPPWDHLPFTTEGATDVVVQSPAQAHAPTDGGVANATAPADGAAAANATPRTESPVVADAPAVAGARPRAGSSSSGGSKPTSSSSSSGNRPTGGNRPSSSSHASNSRWDDDAEPAMPWRVGLSILGGLLGFMFLVGVWIVVMNMRANRKEAKEQERWRAGVAADAESYDT